MNFSREEWVAAGVFALLLLACGGLWYACRAPRRKAQALFGPRLGDYLAAAKDCSLGPIDLGGPDWSPHRKGKLVVVSAEKRELDPLHFKLSGDLRAAGPEEAGSLVLVEAKSHKSGSYGFFADAYYVDWKLCVVDLSTRKATALFGYGMSPPRGVRLPFWDRYGDKPSGSMRDDLEKLPAR